MYNNHQSITTDMKRLLFFPVLFLTFSTFAQGVLQFKEKEILLKDLPADDQPTTVTYTFTNKGDQPIIISRISPMSSQIRADWDRKPIAPKETGNIRLSFNSVQMPPNFNYNILVYSNATPNRDQIRLGANIVDNPQKPELLYRYNLEGLKFKNSTIQLNNIYDWQIVSDTVYFFNTRKDSVQIGVNYTPAHITVTCPDTKAAPGQQGKLIITYDAPKKNDYGHSYESIILSIDNKRDYKNRLSVTANITEDFSKLSKKQLANAPVASFEKKEISFGDIKPKEKATCDFKLTNTGKSDLIIRKTRASCGCTAVALGQNTIAPGESTVIRATFDSTGKSGRQYKTITVITNDPKSPEYMLTISGNIKAE